MSRPNETLGDTTWSHPRVEALAELLPARRRALLDSLAGTGKTECVAQLAITLVLEHGLEPDRISVLSFNEKAAREARDRIREVAERLLTPPAPSASSPVADPLHRFVIDAPARAALRALLRRPPRVQTIHAWAKDVLTHEAFAARFPLGQQLVSRGEAFGEAFRALVRRRLAQADAPDLIAWLEERDLGRLEALLRRCAGEEPTTLLRPRLDPDQARLCLAAVAELPRRPWGRLRAAVANHAFGRASRTQTKLAEVLRGLPEQIERAAEGDGRLAPHGPRLAGDVRYVLEKLRRHVIPTASADPLPERLAALSTAQVAFDAAAANLWTEPARAAYEEHKRALGGALDFDDLLRVLEEALAGPDGEALRARVRAGCDAVLIDEVQDANATIYGYDHGGQARGLFRPLFIDAGFSGRAFLAGDGHQSIYGWRGADVHGGFLTARRDMEARDGVIRLRASFRSTPRFVTALNVLFDQSATPPFFQGQLDYATPAEAGRPDLRLLDSAGGDAAPVQVLALETNQSRVNVGPLRLALAGAIAREVDRLCRTDAGALTLTEPGRPPRRFGLADVFVLVRTHREAREVHQACAGFEPPIPAVLHKAGGVFAGAEAEDVADLLAALAAPTRLELKRRACLTPFFDVPLENLSGLGDLPPGSPLELRWRRWCALAARNLPRLLATVVDDSGLAARARFGGLDGERSLGTYQHLLEVLASQLGRVGGDASGLVTWLEGRRADAAVNADRQEHPIRQPGAAEDAVRIMTVYAAKGLGAGCVFLTGGFTAREDREGIKVYQAPTRAAGEQTDEPTAQENPYPVYEDERRPPRYEVYHDAQGRRVLHVGPLDDASAPLYETSRREQDTFLLYTAITRGIGRVVVPFVPRAHGDAWVAPRLSGSYHEPLNQQLESVLARRADDPTLADLFALTPVPLEPTGDPPPPPAAWARLASWSPPPELLATNVGEEDRRALLARHRPQVVVSYSSLKRGEHDPRALVVTEPEEAATTAPTAIVGVSTEALVGGRHTGNLLHGLFEHCDLAAVGAASDPVAWGNLPEVATLLEDLVARYGLPHEQAPVARRVVFHTLTRRIALGPGLVLDDLWSAPCLREPDFRVRLPSRVDPADLHLAPGVALKAGYLTGALDLLLRPAPQTVVGLDWKSDPLDDYGPAALHAKVMQDYPIQLAAYSYVLAKLAGVVDDPTPLDDALDVRMSYVFVRGTGLPGGTPEQGVRTYRLDAAGYRRIEAFLQGIS